MVKKRKTGLRKEREMALSRHMAAQLAAWIEAGAATPGVEALNDDFFEYVGCPDDGPDDTQCFADVTFLALIGKGGIETARLVSDEWEAHGGSDDFEPLWTATGKILGIAPKEVRALSALDCGHDGYPPLSISETISGLRDGSLLERF